MATAATSLAAGGGPVILLSTSGTGAEQVWCGVTARSPARPGEAGPARDEAANLVSARRAGPVTRLPPARPRPAAMCHPVAVVRVAAMTIVGVPSRPGRMPGPALPGQH